MVKKLYKRFLEWALAPVLEPVAEAACDLQAQGDATQAEVVSVGQAVEVLCPQFAIQAPLASASITAALEDIRQNGERYAQEGRERRADELNALLEKNNELLRHQLVEDIRRRRIEV